VINGIDYSCTQLERIGEAGRKGAEAGKTFSEAMSSVNCKLLQRKPPIKKRKKRIAKKLCIHNKLIKALK